ncbi:hypothetical protein [Rhizobium tumorigenes]|uniref:Uncharacterized protein n=1 Tax=Rhizobium tumorigenes TaxID=2041385 RepID=A0AAF1KBE1_9HYPH|nr:hypothetical protein [Rhizobium tumorigenes]WFR98254.1 hypothetical protein PR017_23165 [Rhizobium tumorigenes]WFS03766.1 hypothetical protein PR016_23595 [Rhizobium tumorigenes]
MMANEEFTRKFACPAPVDSGDEGHEAIPFPLLPQSMAAREDNGGTSVPTDLSRLAHAGVRRDIQETLANNRRLATPKPLDGAIP